MEPWTIEAWVAILEALASYAWPVLIFVALLIFRSPLSNSLNRLISLTKDGAKLEPPTQKTEKKPDTLKSILSMDFSSWEPNLTPWLDPIRKEVEQLADTEDLQQRLMLGIALAHRRADFIDVWRQIFGSQAQLLWRLYQGHRISGFTIREVYIEHSVEAGEHALAIETWIFFLTNFALATGDHNEMEITVFGRDFVTFCIDSGFQPSDKAF